jgi:predicted enzyme related to lactoylglutathione lyase
MSENNKINFIEFQTLDISKMKEFYGNTFEWKFTDFGP